MPEREWDHEVQALSSAANTNLARAVVKLEKALTQSVSLYKVASAKWQQMDAEEKKVINFLH